MWRQIASISHTSDKKISTSAIFGQEKYYIIYKKVLFW